MLKKGGLMLTKKIKITQDKAPAFLYWKDKTRMHQKEVGEFLSIGRGESNLLTLNDNFISRRHARIEKKEDSYILKDLNSQNGSFLNGARVKEALLNHNDYIKIGGVKLTFSKERYNEKWKKVFQSKNKAWNETLNRIPHLSLSDFPILILGQSGTGKELIAQMIHQHSKRSSNPLITINCSALTESLVESELFGHTKGSYTGSIERRLGAFLAADQGSLFLDEIGDLPLPLQPKLLRAIEYKEVKPIGSDRSLKTDARIISATHKDLKEKAEREEFRKDLYFRLNVVTVRVPPLKERMEDFDDLLQYFCLKEACTFHKEASKVLKDYHWPGNIRELLNTVKRAKALFPDQIVMKKDTQDILDAMLKNFNDEEAKLWMQEKKCILKALKIFEGRQSKVASYLGIPKSSLSDKICKYKIDVDEFKKGSKNKAL